LGCVIIEIEKESEVRMSGVIIFAIISLIVALIGFWLVFSVLRRS